MILRGECRGSKDGSEHEMERSGTLDSYPVIYGEPAARAYRKPTVRSKLVSWISWHPGSRTTLTAAARNTDVR